MKTPINCPWKTNIQEIAEDQEEEVPDIDPTDFKRQEYNQSGEPVKMKRIEKV